MEYMGVWMKEKKILSLNFLNHTFMKYESVKVLNYKVIYSQKEKEKKNYKVIGIGPIFLCSNYQKKGIGPMFVYKYE